MNGCVGWVNGWMDGLKDEWMCWVGEWMDGWIEG